jgi:hypothetical protein
MYHNFAVRFAVAVVGAGWWRNTSRAYVRLWDATFVGDVDTLSTNVRPDVTMAFGPSNLHAGLHDILVTDVPSFVFILMIIILFILLKHFEWYPRTILQLYIGWVCFWLTGSLPQRAVHFSQFRMRIPPFLVYICMNEFSGFSCTNPFIWFIDMLKDLRPPYGSYKNRGLFEKSRYSYPLLSEILKIKCTKVHVGKEGRSHWKSLV